MSDLQLSLLGLGALLVVGVWSYNKLQERKYRREAEEVFAGDQADVLAAQMSTSTADTEADDEYIDSSEADDADIVDKVDVQAYAHEAQSPSSAYERREPVLESLSDAGAEAEAEEKTALPPASEPAPTYIADDGEAPSFAAATDVVTAAAAAVTPAENTPSTTIHRHAPPADWCDEGVDLVARLRFQAGIPADDLRQAQAAMQGHQRVHLRVFVETAAGQWLPLVEASDAAFVQAWFALQLVDRRGAVSTNDFEALRHSLQALVSLRDGELTFPDVAALGEQARALDEFCAQLDLQLAINVLDAGQGAFAGTKIRGMAEAAGMRLASNGEFQAHDENGNFLFALANMGDPFDVNELKHQSTHGLTFLLDVPHVRDGGYAFERMLSTARQFASTLDAALVNAQRSPVTDVMVNGIRTKIVEIHEQMVLAGIPSGGMRALRLFS